jgi:hypothetical protein
LHGCLLKFSNEKTHGSIACNCCYFQQSYMLRSIPSFVKWWRVLQGKCQGLSFIQISRGGYDNEGLSLQSAIFTWYPSWRWGTAAPFKPPSRRGHIPSLAPPWCIFLIGDGNEKVITFFNNISKTKTSVWGLNRTFYHHLRPQDGGGGVKKGVKRSLNKKI